MSEADDPIGHGPRGEDAPSGEAGRRKRRRRRGGRGRGRGEGAEGASLADGPDGGGHDGEDGAKGEPSEDSAREPSDRAGRTRGPAPSSPAPAGPHEGRDGAPDEGGRRRRRGRGGRGRREDRPEHDAPPRNRREDRGDAPTADVAPRGRRGRGGEEYGEPGILMPVSGKTVSKPRRHAPRGRVLGGLARRARRDDTTAAEAWCRALPEPLLAALVRTLGGSMTDADTPDWVAYSLTRTHRLAGAVHQAHPRDRQALCALLQCGGIAHAEEMHRELARMLGGREPDWARTFQVLCDKGLVFASQPVEDGFYYLVPDPLIAPMQAVLAEELRLPTFEHEGVRVVDPHPFCPPFDFSLATLATWLDQKKPKLTQRQEIFKGHRDELDRFFAQLWSPESEVFALHIDFLTMHGMVQARGQSLVVNRDIVEEWLQLEPEDQRDLVFRALERRMAMAEFLLAAIHGGGGAWIPEEPLHALYRRWMRGEDWRERFHRGQYENLRGGEREGYSFAPLVNCGMLELGVWGQQKFYRLSPRARELVEPAADDGFRQFYLTPSYEIMAPAGLAPILLYRIGEIAELIGCDRANTYRITEHSIANALENGWRRDALLDFLRDNSQIGLPENVEHTLRDWAGDEGDVEFHQFVALTVHRSAIRRIEALRELRPWLVHRFAPGLYAVDPAQLDQIRALLLAAGFHPPAGVKHHPIEASGAEERQRLQRMLAEAREQRNDPQGRDHAVDTAAGDLRPVPGSHLAQNVPGGRGRRKQGLPRVSSTEARALFERALSEGMWVQMTYVSTKDGSRRDVVVIPERMAVNREGDLVAVATDTGTGARLTWAVAQVERGRTVEPNVG
jgi:hypothetical protein